MTNNINNNFFFTIGLLSIYEVSVQEDFLKIFLDLLD